MKAVVKAVVVKARGMSRGGGGGGRKVTQRKRQGGVEEKDSNV